MDKPMCVTFYLQSVHRSQTRVTRWYGCENVLQKCACVHTSQIERKLTSRFNSQNGPLYSIIVLNVWLNTWQTFNTVPWTVEIEMPNKLAASRVDSWTRWGSTLKALFLCYFAMFNPVLIGTLSRVHLPHILPFYFPCKLKEMMGRFSRVE
jgi:hypothetical protein